MNINYLLITLIFLISSFNALSCELKVGIREMPPYSFQDKSALWKGSDIDLFSQLFQVINCEVKFVKVSFGDGLKLLKDGKIDAMSQLSLLPKRRDSIYFIGPIRSEKFTLLTNNTITEDITDLSFISRLPYIFAKREGTYLGAEFETLLEQNKEFSSKFIMIDSRQPRIDLVLKGRVMGFFEESNFKDYQLTHSLKYQELKQHPLELITGEVYLGFSKKTMTEIQFTLLNQYFKKNFQ